MRFYRNAIILVLVLAGLTTAYVFLPRQDKDKDNNSQDPVAVKTFVRENMVEISLKNQKGLITLVRSGTQWKMSKPGEYKLDEVSTESFVNQMSNIKAESIIEENAQDLEKYGLASPESTVAVKTSNGVTTLLMLGDEAPVGGGYFLKTSDSNAVYKVDEYTAGEFARSVNEFRDKMVFGIKPEDVSGFAFSKQGEVSLKFLKTGEWEVVTPEGRKKGIQEDISNVIDKISNLRVKEFIIDDVSESLSKYALENPRYTITLTLKNGKEEFLLVGNKKDDTSFYVKKPVTNEVFTVDSSDLNFVEKGADNYIKK